MNDKPLLSDQSRSTLSESYHASLLIKEMQLQGLQHHIYSVEHQISLMRRSLSWRLTTPLRFIRWILRGELGKSGTALWSKNAWEKVSYVYRTEGVYALYKRIQTRYFPKRRSLQKDENYATTIENIYTRQVKQASDVGFTPTIVIIAELSLLQCAKYRVWQKQAALEKLGWVCHVVDWRDAVKAKALLQFCQEVIFYRVPGFDTVLELVAESKRLGLSPYWEVDDLIFNKASYQENNNIARLAKKEYELLMFGVKKFRACMLACDRGIASTQALADAMRKEGMKQVEIIENALDNQTLEIAENIAKYHEASHQPVSRNHQDKIIIIYGSGTKTHDADFMIAAPAIFEVMKTFPNVIMRIVGDLTIPEFFSSVKDQIEYITSKTYSEYLRILSESDIAIAPLEETIFNECKSNIKFIEASLFSLPSVCSPREPFRRVITHGENGYLAQSEQEWIEALSELVSEADVRVKIGQAARKKVFATYHPDQVAEQQVAKVFPFKPVRRTSGLRALTTNIYYSPRSFGGATFVAEELDRRLVQKGVQLGVFTSKAVEAKGINSLTRYEIEGKMPVVAMALSDDHGGINGLNSEYVAEYFGWYLQAFKPDVVYVHSIQGLGAAILRECLRRDVPYVITLHDAWWLCERQFMVNQGGHYCYQTRIDLGVCQICVPHARHLTERHTLLHHTLQSAAALIAPSESHASLYRANNLKSDQVKVIKNGVIAPIKPRVPKKRGAPIRFGYVGGREGVKGYPLIEKVFSSLNKEGWRLILVDNKLNLGFSSIEVSHWKTSKKVEIVSAYNNKTIDDYFNSIDVLLFPSQWKESYGLTVREALLRDVWVIATAEGGQGEDIVDGENGTLIPMDGQAETLKKAVEALISQPGFLDHYTNPYKDQIQTYEHQAESVYDLLVEASLAQGKKISVAYEIGNA